MTATISPMLTAAGIQKRLGLRLRHHRERVGLTQVALAESIGLDASTIRALESGRRGCSLHVLVNLAQELGITPGELLDAQTAKDAETANGVLAAQVVASLEPQWQVMAIDLLKVLKKRTAGSD